MEPLTILFLILGGFFAGFIGVTAGGSGLVIIPFLLSIGLSAQNAIATSKLAVLGLVSVGWYKYHKAKKIDYKIAFPIVFLFITGAFFGANLLLYLPSGILKKAIAIIILLVLMLVIFKKDLGTVVRENITKRHKAIGLVAILGAGFIDGLIGVGGGILAGYIVIMAFGQTFLRSAGIRMIARLGSTIVIFLIFLLNDLVNWNIGLILLGSTIVGSYVGVHIGLKKGNRWVRGLFILVVVFSVMKILFEL